MQYMTMLIIDAKLDMLINDDLNMNLLSSVYCVLNFLLLLSLFPVVGCIGA